MVVDHVEEDYYETRYGGNMEKANLPVNVRYGVEIPMTIALMIGLCHFDRSVVILIKVLVSLDQYSPFPCSVVGKIG